MSQSLVHPKQAASGMSLGRLLILTGVVLAAHLFVLSAPELDFAAKAPDAARALMTRTIVMPSPATAPPRTVTTPKPRTVPAKPPARPSPQPTATPAPATEPGNAPAPQDLTVLGPTSAEAVGAAAPVPEPTAEMTAERPPRDDSLSARVYAVPTSARLSYRIEADRFPYTADAELTWQQDGKNYQATMAIRKLITVRSQASVGSIGPDGLAPTRFSDKTRSEVAAHFDRDSSKVTFSANTPEAALLAGTQDQLSLPLQLAAMVAGEPEKYASGSTITIQVVGPRQASLWLLTVEGTETLTLPIGELTTLKLQRNPRQPYDQKVEVWLAPEHGYLPVRIRLTEPNGAYLDQKLQKIEGLQ